MPVLDRSRKSAVTSAPRRIMFEEDSAAVSLLGRTVLQLGSTCVPSALKAQTCGRTVTFPSVAETRNPVFLSCTNSWKFFSPLFFLLLPFRMKSSRSSGVSQQLVPTNCPECLSVPLATTSMGSHATNCSCPVVHMYGILPCLLVAFVVV